MTANETVTPSILRYQRGRTLDKVPAYKTGIQVRLVDGSRAYVALSSTELVIYFHVTPPMDPTVLPQGGPGIDPTVSELAVHYDLEGRLTKVVQPNQYWRRSLSNRVMFTRKLARSEGGGLQWLVLHSDDVDALLDQMHANVAAVHEELVEGDAQIEFGKPSVELAIEELKPLLGKAARFDLDAARADAERFHTIYGRVAILPPDQYNAFVLQATQGCSHNACVFCTLYRGVRYQPKPATQFREHVQAAVAYHGHALRARRSIFLGEANALTLPQPELVKIFGVLNEHFELPSPEQTQVPADWWLGNEKRFDGINSFMDCFTGPHRPTEQLVELRRLGLRRLYIGVETGCDELSKWLRKPATAEAVGTWVRAIIEAGIHVGVIVMIGAGGEQFNEKHVRDTTLLLNQLPLGRGDFIYFSPLVIAESGSYAAKSAACGVEHLTPAQMRRQEEQIRAGLTFEAHRGQPYLARYELETFVY